MQAALDLVTRRSSYTRAARHTHEGTYNDGVYGGIDHMNGGGTTLDAEAAAVFGKAGGGAGKARPATAAAGAARATSLGAGAGVSVTTALPGGLAASLGGGGAQRAALGGGK